MKRSLTVAIHRWVNAHESRQGVALLEALIAIAIFGIAFVAILGAVATSARATNKSDISLIAANLAISQMEYVKSQPYLPAPATYAVIAAIPIEYTIVVEATPITGYDEHMQKIIVTVQHNGVVAKVLESLKADK